MYGGTTEQDFQAFVFLVEVLNITFLSTNLWYIRGCDYVWESWLQTVAGATHSGAWRHAANVKRKKQESQWDFRQGENEGKAVPSHSKSTCIYI